MEWEKLQDIETILRQKQSELNQSWITKRVHPVTVPLREIHFKAHGLHFIQTGSMVEFPEQRISDVHTDEDIMVYSPNIVGIESSKQKLALDIYYKEIILEMIDFKGHPGYVKLYRPQRNIWLNGIVLLSKQNSQLGEFITQKLLKWNCHLGKREHNKLLEGPTLDFKMSEVDLVPCIQVPYWPQQAQWWVTRDRCHGYPNSAIIQTITSKGCHAVCKNPPNISDDDCVFRLSFSVAEKELIWMWEPVHQLVYFILKKLREKLSLKDLIKTYYIKTAMFWWIEQQPPTYWTRSLVFILNDLWGYLYESFETGYLPHYFIDHCSVLGNLEEYANYHDMILDDYNFLQLYKEILNEYQMFFDTCETRANPRTFFKSILKGLDSLTFSFVHYFSQYAFKHKDVPMDTLIEQSVRYLTCVINTCYTHFLQDQTWEPYLFPDKNDLIKALLYKYVSHWDFLTKHTGSIDKLKTSTINSIGYFESVVLKVVSGKWEGFVTAMHVVMIYLEGSYFILKLVGKNHLFLSAYDFAFSFCCQNPHHLNLIGAFPITKVFIPAKFIVVLFQVFEKYCYVGFRVSFMLYMITLKVCFLHDTLDNHVTRISAKEFELINTPIQCDNVDIPIDLGVALYLKTLYKYGTVDMDIYRQCIQKFKYRMVSLFWNHEQPE